MDKKIKKIEGRDIAIKALVGSHNYNLNTSLSDRDYKYFVYPTFDDLYSNEYYSQSSCSFDQDYTVHDIRKLCDLLFKANINFLEVLFSKEYTADKVIEELLWPVREDFITCRRRHFFDACIGTYKQKNAKIHRECGPYSPGNELIREFGYNTKEACHALRCLKVAYKYFVEKKSFEESIWFDDNLERAHMITLKSGGMLEADYIMESKQLYEKLDALDWDFIDGSSRKQDQSYKKCQAVQDKIKEIIKDRIVNNK